MHISYCGLGCFALRGKDATVITDPFDPKEAGVPLKKLKGDIVTLSREKGNGLSSERVDFPDDKQLVVDWPGEYEYKGASIIGIQTWQNKKGEKGEDTPNTVYTFFLDDIHLCHLGKLGHALASEQIEEIGDIDILMVPVGGIGSLDVRKSKEIIEKIEPRIVIPMYYALPHTKEKFDTLQTFLKVVDGVQEKAETLKVSKRDLPAEEKTKVVILQIR